jgi:hypothetical protein|tara:strand:+ start:6946 stop:7173 length:228 start_codon:yes stop_codon:yes gene_type:complete
MSVKKFKIDDIVFYQPFKNDTSISSEILKNISKKAVIINVYDNKNEFYDYEICILDTGEFKKVIEQLLTIKENQS